MTLLASQPGSCGRRHFDPGHFTASAFVLSPAEDAVLLIEHSKLGIWIQPGGHVDPSDASLEAAARREAAEETGLVALELLSKAPLDLDIHTIPARRDEPAHEHFDVRFLYRASTLEIRAGSDALAARWVRFEEVAGLQSDESVRRAVRKLVRERRGRA